MIYAEDLPYWQTSTTDPDTWIEKTIRVLIQLGGKLQMEGYGKDEKGQSAYLIAFTLKNELHRIVWPVFPSRTNKPRAAKIQAATILYHYIKALSVASLVIGAETALFVFLQLPDGSTVLENRDAAIAQSVGLFRLPSKSGNDEEIIDGEVSIY